MTEGPRSAYRRRESQATEARDAARAASLRISTARAVTFVAAAACLVFADVVSGVAAWTAVALAAGLVLAFVVLVSRHRRVRRQERWQEEMRRLCHEGLLRLDRRWADLEASLPAVPSDPARSPVDHAYARDLNVEGGASLSALLGPVTTIPGRSALRRWLLSTPVPAEAVARSQAARELAPMLDDRLELAAHGRLAPAPDAASLDVFSAWAEADAWLLHHRWLRAAAVVLPTVLAATVYAHAFLGIPGLWILPGVLQAIVLKRFQGRLGEDLGRVESMGPALASYVPQIRALHGWPMRAGALRGISDRLRGPEGDAWESLRSLAGLVDTVQSRRNMVYAALSLALLLDVHVTVRLDRWRAAHGGRVRDWLAALGEAEALAALGSLTHDHPDWAFPSWIESDAGELRAVALGHPLLLPADCVRNDVTLGPPGTFLLVTGSNMSGKSTLLRAIGANVVLAAAGAPVCAEALALTPVRVRTSMRIEDSLADGISLFMAELLRVRDIVRAAEAEGAPVLFLLDEILHGTNTAERRIAAQAVVLHLVEHRAIGAVSTHDLTLAESPRITPHAVNVHFREQVRAAEEGTRLSFDYVLRPGVATTRNALRLLEAVGLDWDLKEGE